MDKVDLIDMVNMKDIVDYMTMVNSKDKVYVHDKMEQVWLESNLISHDCPRLTSNGPDKP